MRWRLPTELTISSHNNLLLKRFSGVSRVELLTLGAECSLFTSKPAHSSRYLPHLRGHQRLCGKPAIPQIDRLLVVTTGQIRMGDRQVQVALRAPRANNCV